MSAEPATPIRYGPGWDLLWVPLTFVGAAAGGWLMANRLDFWPGWIVAGWGVVFGPLAIWNTWTSSWLRADANGIRVTRLLRGSRRIPWHEVRDIEAGDWDGPSVVRVLVRDGMGSEQLIDITPGGGPGVYRVRDQLLDRAARAGAPVDR